LLKIVRQLPAALFDDSVNPSSERRRNLPLQLFPVRDA
jgi:hypothetical protein